MSKEESILQKIGQRYLLLRLAEIAFLAAGIAAFGFALTSFLTNSPPLPWIISLFIFILILVLRIASLKLHQLAPGRVAIYLNQHYPELQASVDLLLSPKEDLTSLEGIQKLYAYQRLQSIEQQIKFPHHLLLATIVFFVGGSSLFLSSLHVTNTTEINIQNSEVSHSKDSVKQPVIPALARQQVQITPPTYTQLKSMQSSNLHLRVVEGSLVKWIFELTGEPQDPLLIFSGKDSIKLKSNAGSFEFQKNLVEAGFYQLAWKDQQQKLYQTDYYPIEIIKDEGPKIEVTNLPQFVELKLTDRLIVDLKANLTDDFGLKDSHIIATVSKGSGESVKFREETLRFTQPAQFSGKQQAATRAIDIIKLGLEPGDELYFYIEAFDNKLPIANKSRTETFFIALKDTSTYVAVDEEGLGVDLMPEYFRSQRQIIIDSEKLLEERKKNKVKKEDFNFRSNELGYDQKVLRLRYGQFLGEEADSGIGHEVAAHPGEEEDEEGKDPTDKYTHKHDTENEHNLVADKKAGAEKEHHHEQSDEANKNPLEAFAHNHDNTEEATFFVQSVKTKLRTALTLMWDAELYLRMYDPATSLPYQYKILKLLKEISNDSRVYVHRTGFDPPPLKEDNCLGGDLSEIKNSSNQRMESKEEIYPAIRQGLIIIERLLQTERTTLDATNQSTLQKAGNELAAAAIIGTLFIIAGSPVAAVFGSIAAGVGLWLDYARQVQRSFWNVLPREAISPSGKQTVIHPLDAQFLQQLEEVKHDR